MAWLVLLISGLFEAIWAVALGESNGFRRRRPTLLFLVSLPISMLGLAFAMIHIPIGTAYAVWVGIGATLTVLWAIATRREEATTGRLAMLLLLVGSVVGLKVVS